MGGTSQNLRILPVGVPQMGRGGDQVLIGAKEGHGSEGMDMGPHKDSCLGLWLNKGAEKGHHKVGGFGSQGHMEVGEENDPGAI